MKKLLNISVIAALAVLPLAASAAVGDIVSVNGPATAASKSQAANDVTAASGPKYALATVGANDGNVATAGYVKGAYNEAIKAINKVSETASNALTADGEAILTNKTIDANGTGNSITNLETEDFASGVVRNSTAGIRAVASAEDDKLVTEKAVASAIDGMVTETGTQTLTNKTIDADDNTISDLELDNFKSGVVVDSTTGIAGVASASDTKVLTEKAVASAIDGMVTETGTQTLTNKTIDGDDNTIQDLGFGVFKSGVIVDSTTGIAAASSASDSKLVTEKAAATAIEGSANKATYSSSTNYDTGTVGAAIKALQTGGATQTGVENTVETATITANVPTVTTWGTDAIGTIAIENVSISATYAEPAPAEPEPEPEP